MVGTSTDVESERAGCHTVDSKVRFGPSQSSWGKWVSGEILLVGDIHLGRRPQRLARAELDDRALSPAVAWERTVDLALRSPGAVQAVVLAGDVVDQEKDRFEAWDDRDFKRSAHSSNLT